MIFRAVLPPELLQHLDFAQAELKPSLFHNEEFKGRRSDFLFKVPLGDESEVYVLTLLEHQSSVDHAMAARMLVYMGRAIERHLDEHRGAKQIPALIPVVLYHGAGRWNAATELFDLYALPEQLKPVLRGVAPSFRFLLDDLSQVSDDELRQRPGLVLSRVALIVMRHAQELRTAADPAFTLRSLATSVGDLLQQVLDRTGRTGVFRYMLEIVELDPKEGEEILVQALPTKVKEDVVTAADQLRARGEVKGMRRLLLSLLRQDFGALSAEVERRVAHANEEQLETWAGRVRSASNLDEVFAFPE